MLLNRIGAKNYFVFLIIMLAIAVALVIATFLVTAFIPNTLGQQPYIYNLETVNEFEPWSFMINDFTAIYPRGGIIVTVYETARKRSVMILGEGSCRRDGEELNQGKDCNLFMVVDHDLFEQIRSDNIFTPVGNESTLRRVHEKLEKQRGLPLIWKDIIPMVFHGQEGLVYYYTMDADGEPLMPPMVNFSQTSLYGSFAVYALFVLLMFPVLTILSPDHHYSIYWRKMRSISPGTAELVAALLAPGLAVAGEIWAATEGLHEYYASAGYAAGIFILALMAGVRLIGRPDFGLRLERIRHGYLLALVAAALIVGAARGLPSGLSLEGTGTILVFAGTYFLIALPREIIWRGYVLTVLSRTLGHSGGLLLTALLATGGRLLFIMATEPWMLSYPYTALELAVLTPGLALITGFLYLRTENTLACALLHSLILFLPGILIT